MASSQVQIASSSPFGCVAPQRDRHNNRRDHQYSSESNGRAGAAKSTATTQSQAAAFQKNLKDLVLHKHFHSSCCMSRGPPPLPRTSSSASHQISYSQSHNANDLWVHPYTPYTHGSNHRTSQLSNADENNNNNLQTLNVNDLWVQPYQQSSNQRTSQASKADENNNNGRNPKESKVVVDRCTQGCEIGFSVDTECHNCAPSHNSPPQSNTSAEIPNVRGVSSLVQRWRDFEADKKSQHPTSTSPLCPCSATYSGSAENASIPEAPTPASDAGESSSDERYETQAMTAEDSLGDWESNRTATCCQGIDSAAAEERERVRVMDIIRKLPIIDGQSSRCGRTSSLDQPERNFFLVIPSPRIRGRQAFADLLLQMERDRHKELERLLERKAVSRFSQRGRIQALLRLIFLRRGTGTEAQATYSHRQCPSSTLSDTNRTAQGSNIIHLRERFNTGVEHCAADPRSLCREVVDNIPEMEKSSTSSRLRQNSHHQEATHREVIADIVDVKISSVPTPAKDNHLQENCSNSCQSTLIFKNRQITSHEFGDCKETSPRSHANRRGTNHEVGHTEEASPTSNANKERTSHEVGHSKESSPRSHANQEGISQEVGNSEEAPSPRSHANRQGTSHSASHEPAVVAVSHNGLDENRKTEERDVNNSLPTQNQDWTTNICSPQKDCVELEANDQQFIEFDCDCASDVCRPQRDWEEQSNYQLEETNLDWIKDISRPQSEWEVLRQARYLEMLDPYLDNRERRQLLERKCVSNFLSSHLRDCIDRLMLSRTQGYPHQVEGHGEEQQVEEKGKKEDDVMEEETGGKKVVKEELGDHNYTNNGDDDNDGEGESPTEQQYNDIGNYTDQPSQPHIPYSSHSRSQYHDHEGGDVYDQVASPSLHPSFSSNSYSQDNRQCFPFMNHPSIEMELIYDLRGHMELLRQEMAELRSSINSCMNMQATLQQSIKKEVASVLNHSAPEEQKDPTSNALKKGHCCICHEAQVDSLLYRCGHMCTCFKCAHDLQCNNGKCPICRAQIMDVVRAYADTEVAGERVLNVEDHLY